MESREQDPLPEATKPIAGSESQVAEYWSDCPTEELFSGATFWLGNEAVLRRYTEKVVNGRPYDTWLDFCIQHFLGSRLPVDRILTIGCGDGELERHLMAEGAAKAIDAIDVAPKRIETARRHAAAAGIDRIRYLVRNAEDEPFPGSGYDAVIYDSSLHHIFDLEGVLEKTARALAPGGFLFANEYVGPSYFGFSEREKEIILAAWELIPEKYRRSCAAENRGQLQPHPAIHDPAEVRRVDPSESVRSAEILTEVRRRFEIVELNLAGGTILHTLLTHIVGNFRPDDPSSMAVLELLFRLEDTLLEIGEIESHFALIVAAPRKSST